MKLGLAVTLVLAACGGIQPPRESPIVREGSDAPEHCCCKHTPLASDGGRPLYEMANRMECSAKQGECVADVQCQKPTTPP
jgi:hypothetical protein